MPFDINRIQRTGIPESQIIEGAKDTETGLRLGLNAIEPHLTESEKEKVVAHFRDQTAVFYFDSRAKIAWKRDEAGQPIGRTLRVVCAIERGRKLEDHYVELDLEAM